MHQRVDHGAQVAAVLLGYPVLALIRRPEPGNFRHIVELSNWRIDPAISPGTFSSERAAKANRIDFASPDEKLPQPK